MLQLLFYGIWKLFSWALQLFSLAMFVYVLMSWFPGAYNSKLGRILERVVGPYLEWFRRFVPPIVGVDLSPILAFAVVYLFDRAINILYFNIVTRLFS